VLIPEAMPELNDCCWTGDGRYDLSAYHGRGPPTLGQIVIFLRQVEELAEQSSLMVVLSSVGKRAVGAVLIGAWLVLAQGLSAQTAWARILLACPAPSTDPELAWDHFAPTFSRAGTTCGTSLTVLDCLLGLEAARDLGWMPHYRMFDLEEWQFLREKIDATWIIPGEVLAMANPQGSACNPRFPGLLDPPKQREAARTDSYHSPQWLHLPAIAPESSRRRRTMTPPGESPSSPSCSTKASFAGSFDEGSSVSSLASDEAELHDWKIDDEHTPRRKPVRTSMLSQRDLLENDTFSTYLSRTAVHTIIRLNFDFECPEQFGYETVFQKVGIDIMDMPFQDGTVPSKEVVRGFLAQCKEMRDNDPGGCIAVHCMGGLGRTGVMIGAYAACYHGVRGNAFHGWTRLCRPGTIQTVRQEAFIRSLMPEESTPRRVSKSIRKLFGSIHSRLPGNA